MTSPPRPAIPLLDSARSRLARSRHELATSTTVLGLVLLVGLVLHLHPIASASRTLVAEGARPATVEHLLMVPVGVLAIVFGRTFVGLETFGLMTPLILGFAFERMGTLEGLAIYLALIALVTPLRMLLEHVSVLSVARTGALITLCALVLLVVLSLGTTLLPGIRAGEIGLPVIAMAGVIDRFVSAQMDQSPKEALKLSIHTLVVATAVSALVSLSALRGLVAGHPDLLVLGLPTMLLLGRYRGLRLLERWRFRAVPAKAST